MNKEIVIGGNKAPNWNSTSLWHYADISENINFYILSNKLFDVTIFIVKDSKEAKKLEVWLTDNSNKNNEAIQEKSLEYLLPFITANDIKNMVDRIEQKSYNAGYGKAQYNIRKALGISE